MSASGEDPGIAGEEFAMIIERIARSSPHTIRSVAEATDAGLRGPGAPFISWTPVQRDGLQKAILAQVRVLQALARVGDQGAFLALCELQSSWLAGDEHRAELYPLVEELDNQFEAVAIGQIRQLLQLAMGGDYAALKAAADLHRGIGYFEAADLPRMLPDGLDQAGLKELIERYDREAAEDGLPPLAGEPFGG